MLFASARLLTAATSDGILDFGDTPLCHSHPTLITFDPPGGPALDMMPSGMDPAGAIAGTYVNYIYPNYVFHVFLRAPDGTVTTIDPPGSTGAYCGGFNFFLANQSIQPGPSQEPIWTQAV